MSTEVEHLKLMAKEAARRAYAPYSQFSVGAVIKTHDGTLISGCNVENVSYGLSNCAERTAIFRAIAEGVDVKSVDTVVIYTPTKEIHSPCGACRQVMAEFLQGDTTFMSFSEQGMKQWTVSQLLPDGFSF
ncbi:cytidine deaminase [Idiomarina seosinensis]|uniref:cytidine deaminase n=1 Tax=Idiomarina seosinensis TaxID=281739 RepID=UPI00384DF6FD